MFTNIDNIDAEEYIMVIHTNFEVFEKKIKIHPKITRYIAVSKESAKAFENITGIKPEVIYNPISLNKPRKVLKLISATRLTKEKGINEMEYLANLIEKENIPYIWLCLTDKESRLKSKGIIFKEPELDISSYIAEADYLVQLSKPNVEGYSYTINEALKLGIPIISTEQSVYEELGIKNGVHGYIGDIKKIDIKEIYNKKYEFKYTPPKSEWRKELVKGKSKKEKNKMYIVEANDKCKNGFLDLENNIMRYTGDRWNVDYFRLKELMGENLKGKCYVKVVEEI